MSDAIKVRRLQNLPVYSIIKPYLFIFIAGLFLLFEMCLQTSIGVITPQLMKEFAIDAAGLGFIGSFYYYSYSVMQIPGGMLFDAMGTKKVISSGAMFCAFGTLFFVSSNSVFMLALGRFLTGLGSALAFVSVLYVGSQWFAHRYFALISGITMVMASIGAMCGQMLLAHLVNIFGWRETLMFLAMLCALLSIISYLVIEDKSIKKAFRLVKLLVILRELGEVLKHKQTWYIAIFAFAIWSPITGFASLWGVPFIKEAYSLSVQSCAFSCSLIWVGVAFGSMFFGWWSEKLKRRKVPLIFGAVLGLVSSILIIYLPMNVFMLDLLLICFGTATGGQALIFAVMSDITSKSLIGTGVGLINMAVVGSGIIFQPVIGIVLNMMRSGPGGSAQLNYTLGDYQVALIVIPLIFLAAFLVSAFFLKETHHG